jgi:type IV pilus biogenesis protein CpaD/CtpE
MNMTNTKMKMHWLTLVYGVALILSFAGCAVDDGGHGERPQARACPLWVDFPEDDHSNADSPYLDCISRINLVNMLEAPADLEQGRSLGPSSGEREAVVLKDYDQNKSTTFKDINAPAPPPPGSGSSGGGSSP